MNGVMVALNPPKLEFVPLQEAVAQLKLVPVDCEAVLVSRRWASASAIERQTCCSARFASRTSAHSDAPNLPRADYGPDRRKRLRALKRDGGGGACARMEFGRRRF